MRRERAKKTRRKGSNLILASTPDHLHDPSLSEDAQSTTTDDELVRGTSLLRVKEEMGGEEEACPLATPDATPNTSTSSFISSLKVRTLDLDLVGNILAGKIFKGSSKFW